MSARPTTIVACPNGPLLVRGDAALETPDGEAIDRHGRNTVALCRCGTSTIKPFCDGSHKMVGFRSDPQPSPGAPAPPAPPTPPLPPR